MKLRTKIVLWAVLAMIVAGGTCGFVIHKYPHLVRRVVYNVIPQKQVKYSAKAGNYREAFNDLHQRHYKTASQVGLKQTPASREHIKGMMDELVKVKTCKAYTLAPMGYSAPYLRPNAKDVLDKIGTAFRDSLKSKGLPDHKIVVTSLLRTKADIERLRKNNVNASANSCHCFGTTFDISYVRYDRPELGKSMSQDDLKKVLAEVLYDQKKAGNIYVKYEVKQPCFHITSRK